LKAFGRKKCQNETKSILVLVSGISKLMALKVTSHERITDERRGKQSFWLKPISCGTFSKGIYAVAIQKRKKCWHTINLEVIAGVEYPRAKAPGQEK
jgi:hypothetical protein